MQEMEGEVEATPDLLAGLLGTESGEVFDMLLVLLADGDDDTVDDHLFVGLFNMIFFVSLSLAGLAAA